MTAIKWYVPTSVQTLLSSGLDSLANNAEVTSSAYDNSTALDMYADFVFAVQYNAAPSAGTKVAELYLLPTVDGTNYPTTGSDGLPQKATLIGTFETRSPSTSALEYLTLSGVPIPPGSFKVLLSNTSGQAYKDNSASKFLKMRPYQLQST